MEPEINPQADDPLEDLFWRDEILQVMYWLRGEGLSEAVTPQELVVFLAADETLIRQHLERLVEEAYVARMDGTPVRYQLTEWGAKEAGRRFAEAFADLTKQAHGECNNPNCSCHTEGPDACAAHAPHEH